MTTEKGNCIVEYFKFYFNGTYLHIILCIFMIGFFTFLIFDGSSFFFSIIGYGKATHR